MMSGVHFVTADFYWRSATQRLDIFLRAGKTISETAFADEAQRRESSPLSPS
jgi:hypothetical protein